MLLPQSPKKKSKQEDLPPSLETPEECRRAEERDQALTKRAEQREAEAAADRTRSELTRDKVVFGFELIVAGIVLMATLMVLAFNPQLFPVALLSGGGIGSFVAFLKRKPTED